MASGYEWSGISCCLPPLLLPPPTTATCPHCASPHYCYPSPATAASPHRCFLPPLLLSVELVMFSSPGQSHRSCGVVGF